MCNQIQEKFTTFQYASAENFYLNTEDDLKLCLYLYNQLLLRGCACVEFNVCDKFKR